MNVVILACSSMARQAAAMGFCGGSWESAYAPARVVVPRADGAPRENLKEPGHIYIRDTDAGRYSLEGLRASVCERYRREQGLALFGKWFASYTHADIIDTGTYDSRAEDFLEQARCGAEITGCKLRHAPGGNIALEKPVSGDWDDLFAVADAGETLTRGMFFPQAKHK